MVMILVGLLYGEFPSYAKALECHSSKEYQDSWAVAKKTTKRHMQVVEGFNTE